VEQPLRHASQAPLRLPRRDSLENHPETSGCVRGAGSQPPLRLQGRDSSLTSCGRGICVRWPRGAASQARLSGCRVETRLDLRPDESGRCRQECLRHILAHRSSTPNLGLRDDLRRSETRLDSRPEESGRGRHECLRHAFSSFTFLEALEIDRRHREVRDWTGDGRSEPLSRGSFGLPPHLPERGTAVPALRDPSFRSCEVRWYRTGC